MMLPVWHGICRAKDLAAGVLLLWGAVSDTFSKMRHAIHGLTPEYVIWAALICMRQRLATDIWASMYRLHLHVHTLDKPLQI